MDIKSRFTGSVLVAFAAIVMLAVPVAGNAQQTTSSIRGKVLDSSGNVMAGASVVVEDTRSGVDRSYSTNSSGLFLATRLLPGGPYRVTVNNSETVRVASINVGDIYNLTINMTGAAMEEIIAVGRRGELVEVAAGPSATFNLADLQNSVSFSRDISDVYGIDPRLMIDVDEDGIGINCGGKHPRFNATTLDGVAMGDRFGLNENGYSTAVGMPFPYDAIEQIAVELAPFDVTYAGFSACIINAVTKSGTNEWEGSGFYEFSNNNLRGDTVKGNTQDFSRPSYDKTFLGFNIGGPIIKDKLFVFAAYEKTDEPRFLAKGYTGSGSGEERPWLSQADYDRINAIAQGPIYNYDTGGQPGDGKQETEKYMVRVDWNINDTHNAALIYNFFDGFQDRDSDGDDNEFETSNHYYVKGAEAETITFKLSSQWTDAFSTEFFYSESDMHDSQVTVGDPTFADTQITIEDSSGRNTFYLGADDSRQANSLNWSATYLKLRASYLLGDHVISGGFDREELDTFNIFVQHSRGGEYDYFDDSFGDPAACAALDAQGRFDDPTCGTSGIDKFELGRPSRIFYGSAGVTNNANDAAAVFTNTLNALYIQDEFFFDDKDLTVVAGLRYEWFDSSDRPTFNQAFADATNGLPNDANLDGIDLVMPRIGVTWGVRDDLTLRGGIGLYSGGNPNVWISNAYSNDGITNVQPGGRSGWNSFDFAAETGTTSGFTILPGFADSIALTGAGDQPNRDVPQLMFDEVANTTVADGSAESLALIDPNFKAPAEWKFAIGGTWDMPWGDMTLDFDYLHTQGKNPAYYRDVSQAIDTTAGVNGFTLAGTPIYDYFGIGQDNLMLTNSSEKPKSDMISFVLSKDFDFGLSAQFGYSYIEGEDVASMVASTAGSNFTGDSLSDIGFPPAGNSNWVVPQRFTLGLYYAHEFFGDNTTRISLQGYANEGQPQTYVMESDNFEGDGFNDRHLLYVPTDANDSNILFQPAVAAGDIDPITGQVSSRGISGFDQADQDAFFAFVAANGLHPGFNSRNDLNTKWSTVWHLSIRQDIRFGDTINSSVYLKVKNLGNLLNDDWGRVSDSQYFPRRVVDVTVDDAGHIVYQSFRTTSIQRTYINPSLWEIRIGLDVGFGN
ncbi:MAG: carboxypeptidase regulatory-like domain-containing protein [Proteobacteria bacterium]|nr:carboxypeptidase regulatory-like domain-containing protein [Pseudomonadota bacterium]